jgi:dTDP-4-amino-4,6-dideoxygalactose transaminase
MIVPVSRTDFTEKEFEAIKKPLESGWVVQGPYVKEFEDKWSAFTGAVNSIAVTSCTTAIQVSLHALGIKHGDEVIVPAFTWVATANAVECLGAKPVFCDINTDTFNIDTAQAERLINAKTKAIIPVHLFGLSSDMDAVMALANSHNLKVVEDAACGFGSYYKGIHVGNFGDTGCFSFHPRKAITTGEGGMITTASDSMNSLLRSLRDHGSSVSDFQRHHGPKPYLLPDFPRLGYNFRMTDIQAAIGSAQMDRAGRISQARKKIAAKYDEELKNTGWLKTPCKQYNSEHGYQSYVCMFNTADNLSFDIENMNLKRNNFMEYLQYNGISTRPGTHAVHILDYYAKKYDLKSDDFMNASIAYLCSVALPLYPNLTDDEFGYVIEKIKSYKL